MSTICLAGDAAFDGLKPGPFLANFNEPPLVKALSWKQPFGSLMLHGKAETRRWQSTYRGWVLICTSTKAYSSASHLAIAGERQYSRGLALLDNEPTALLSGVAIGIGQLCGVAPMQRVDEDQCLGQYYPDLLKHLYTRVYCIDPFPFKGGQRWVNLTPTQLYQIAILPKLSKL